MTKPNPIDEAYQRLAAIQREYEEAHAHTVALESELLLARSELSRLQPAEPGGEALRPLVVLGACYCCGRAVTFSQSKWVGKCRRCGTTLHPRRHGELIPGRWELSVCSSMDECSYQNNWYWTLRYRALSDEHPPMGKIYLHLRGELGEALRVEGDSRPIREADRHESYRIIHWAGTVAEDINSAQAWATRLFVESRPF
jgi:hypothetical protein